MNQDEADEQAALAHDEEMERRSQLSAPVNMSSFMAQADTGRRSAKRPAAQGMVSSCVSQRRRNAAAARAQGSRR